MSTRTIEVEAIIHKPLDLVWTCWTSPSHIVNWNYASEDWHCPQAVNDLRVGGSFMYTMASRDGSMSFDFTGVYEAIEGKEKISILLGDGRRWDVQFTVVDHGVKVTERFEPEQIHPEERQRAGWQSILNQFKSYVESQ